MIIERTAIKDCFLCKPNIFKDDRGYFMESFNEKTFREVSGVEVHFVQDNQSYSQRGVLRGLHYQTGAYAQAKLVRVLQGEVLDIAVDIRPDSPTYGQHVAVTLNAEEGWQFFVPKGFAHGFVVLSETATFFYKCDQFYNKESEGGIMYNDPTLNIDWRLESNELIISEKDQQLPQLEKAKQVW